MPAARQAAIVAAAAAGAGRGWRSGRAGAARCSSSDPSRRLALGRSAAGDGEHPEARRGRDRSARAAARVEHSGGRRASTAGVSIDLGCALADHADAPPGSRCTVVIRLRSLSNGHLGDAREPRAQLARVQPELARRRQQRRLGRVTQPPSSLLVRRRAGAAPRRCTARPRSAARPRPAPAPAPVRLRRRGSLRRRAVAGAADRASPRRGPQPRATIPPSVRVPVLSVASTVTEPSVSTAGSRRISALPRGHPPRPERERQGDHRRQRLRDRRHDQADRGDHHQLHGLAPGQARRPARPRTAPPPPAPARGPRPASRRCSGVSPDRCPSARRSAPSRWPRRSRSPRARPRPRTTTVPADTTSPRPSPADRGLVHRHRLPGQRGLVHQQRRRVHDARRRPARCHPRRAPARPRPPPRAAAICRCSPSRSTRASGAASSASAAIAWSAFTSWATPTAVFTTITSTITDRIGPVTGRDRQRRGDQQHQTQRITQLPPTSRHRERAARGNSFGPPRQPVRRIGRGQARSYGGSNQPGAVSTHGLLGRWPASHVLSLPNEALIQVSAQEQNRRRFRLVDRDRR